MVSLAERKVKIGFNMGDFAMKMRNYFFAAAAIVLAASCVKENPAQDNGQVAVNYVPMEFTSAVETKTELSDGKVKWLADDQISIFDNSASAETHNNLFETTGDGSFSGTVPEDATGFYALYPYRAASTLTDGVISAFLSPEQKAVVGSFADDLAVMVAKAEGGSLAFKNVCSHIKFTLAEDLTDVKSITLMGNKAEILAGAFSINWNEGNPSIEYPLTTGENPVPDKTGAEAYVTLRNEDGSALTPGDYYFTVLPVTFSEGFTVILSKTDGTQVAKKTKAANDKIASRNKILVMKPLAASDYADHMNYFVKYNDGFDLTFGGVNINKTTHPGGILSSDNKLYSGNVAAKEEGVYFIHPSCTGAKFNKAEAFKSLVVIGADASQRSDVDFYRQARPYDNGSLILLANLRCTVGDKNAFAQNTKTAGHSFAKFGNMVLSNCHFKNIGKHFMQFNLSAFTEFNLMVEDCEFGFSIASVYVLNTGSMVSTAQNVTFKNNIFYAESSTAATAFKVVHSDKLTIDKFNAESNTFDRTIPETNILRIGDISTSFDMAKNLFYETSKTAGTLKLIAFPVGTNAKNATGTTTNNVYFNSTSDAVLGLGIGTSGFANMSINSIKGLSSNPIPSSWDPANETYGAYVFEDGISETIGAKRADMTPAANSASYRYPATDLGTF